MSTSQSDRAARPLRSPGMRSRSPSALDAVPPLVRLWRYTGGHRRTVVGAITFSVLNKLADVAPELLIGAAVDVVVREGDSLVASVLGVDLTGGPESMAELQRVLGEPGALLGAIQSDEQRALLPRLEALVAVVVGVVDHVMDQVGGKFITSYGMLTEALRRRRVEAGEADRFVERLLGLELTQAVYDRGAAFVEGVVERAGPEGLARLWEGESMLPSPPEVDAPGLWLARIDLPDD